MDVMDYIYSQVDEKENYYLFDDEVLSLNNEGFDSPRWFNNSLFSAPSPKIITKESLLAAQRGDLRRVMDLLSVNEHHARTLLIHYRWDVQRLLAVYVDKGIDCMFHQAGLPTAAKLAQHNNTHVSSTATMTTCYVCMDDDVPGKDISGMACGHHFCNSCWTEHFIVKIEEGQSKQIRCMAHNCNIICDEDIIRKLVQVMRPDLAEKFDRFLLGSYIDDNKMVRWCPSTPHCGNAIQVDNDEFCEVECSCGLQFCFSCAAEAHSPCPCFMWELWTKKCQDESETVNWITVNTKPCPKCHKRVHKDGGCNLVSCICGQAFCWKCGGATGREHNWSNIVHHVCGSYKEDTHRAKRAKLELCRFTHYHNHHKAHIDSLKQGSRLLDTINKKVTILGEKHSKLRDFNWIFNGHRRLFRSRQVLAYSYPFAFCMFGDDLVKDEITKEEREIKQFLFEDHQQRLESNVEKLSKVLEEPFDEYLENQLIQIKVHVVNLTAITDNLCKKLYQCIENDLLGSLQFTTHSIASYQSKGVQKAKDLDH